MHPDAVEAQPEQAALVAGAVEQPRQRKGAGGRIGEQRRRENGGAGIDEGNHLALAAPLQPAVGRHGEVAAAFIADAAGGRCQEQQGVHGGGVEGVGEPDEIRFHAVEPKRVGIDQEERRVAQLRQRLGNAAAGAHERVALVGDDDFRPLPRCQMPLQRVGEIMHVDHGARDIGFGQAVERIIDQRLAGDGDQRFWDAAVERPHARAQPCCQHERAVRHHRA